MVTINEKGVIEYTLEIMEETYMREEETGKIIHIMIGYDHADNDYSVMLYHGIELVPGYITTDYDKKEVIMIIQNKGNAIRKAQDIMNFFSDMGFTTINKKGV